MIRRFAPFISVLGALIAAGPLPAAVTICGWDFQNLTSATNLTPAPDLGGTVGSASAVGMNNSYPTPGPSVDISDVTASTGSSDPAGANNLCWRVRGGPSATQTTASNGWSSLAPIGTQGAQFLVSTVGYSGIKVLFDVQTTAQAEGNLEVVYTIDGVTWKNIPVSYVGTGAAILNNTTSANTVTGSYIQFSSAAWFNQITVDLTGIAGANNNPNFGVRMVNASTGVDCVNAAGTAYNNSSGNWRFDEIQVVASSVATSGPPVITLQPQTAITVASGSTAVFSVIASSPSAVTYQWSLNGKAISGATHQSVLISGATSASAGSYTCLIANSSGSITSNAGVLAVTSTTNPGRLVNLSVNSIAGKSQLLTLGFTSGGSGTSGTENLLVRASGPALSALGVSNVLADPTLSILNGQTVVTSNDNWGTPAGNAALVTAADAATGAFALGNTASLDAALVTPLSSGAYTVQVSGNTAASGTTVAEIYDDTTAYTAASTRLINISCNTAVAPKGTLTAGFTIGGATAKTVLIRGTGPALIPLGVSGTMPDPQIGLFSGSTQLVANAGWGGDSQLISVMASVNAFAIANPASADSVLLVTLSPGSYTAQLTSVTGAAGVAVIEVYEVP